MRDKLRIWICLLLLTYKLKHRHPKPKHNIHSGLSNMSHDTPQESTSTNPDAEQFKPFDLQAVQTEKGKQRATRGQCEDMAASQPGGGRCSSSSNPYQCPSLAPLSGADWSWRRACVSWKIWLSPPSPAIHSGPASEFWWKGTTFLCSVTEEEKVKG